MPFRLPRHARIVRLAASDGVRLEGRLALADREHAVVLCPEFEETRHMSGGQVRRIAELRGQVAERHRYTTQTISLDIERVTRAWSRHVLADHAPP